MVTVPVPPGADESHFAELALVDDLALGFQVMNAASLLESHLEDAISGLDGLYDLVPLLDREGEWFFDVNVLAGATGIDCHPRVPLIGRSDEHRIHIL